MITQITDHEEQAQGLLLEQYQEKPRIAALLASYSEQSQELEDAGWDVLVKRLVDNAEGEQLDALGRLVVQPRDGHDDDVYRLFILAKIRINWSQGNPDDVIAVLRIVEAAAFRYIEHYPASFDCMYTTPPDAHPGVLAELVGMARAAAMHGSVVAAEQPLATCIVGSYDEGLLTDTQGGADEAETIGGIGANVYE